MMAPAAKASSKEDNSTVLWVNKTGYFLLRPLNIAKKKASEEKASEEKASEEKASEEKASEEKEQGVEAQDKGFIIYAERGKVLPFKNCYCEKFLGETLMPHVLKNDVEALIQYMPKEPSGD